MRLSLRLPLLSDINIALRKIVCFLKPTKEIVHDPATGAMKIRTVTTLKNFNMDFVIGEEFEENLGPVDGRICQVNNGRVVDDGTGLERTVNRLKVCVCVCV